MTTSQTWTPFEAPIPEILAQHPEPLLALARGEVPAFVLRQHYNPAHCRALMRRFYERSLLYDPHEVGDGQARRVDIGTSFGHHHRERDQFHAHSAATLALFETLFDGYDDPVRTMYDALGQLAPGKEVKTAREPDGRLYGPAIFRAYHRETGHGPHYDSVAKRTQAFEYQISRFKYQFAGVLCLQNSTKEGGTGEPYLYNCPFRPALAEHLDASDLLPTSPARVSSASKSNSNPATSTFSLVKTSTRCPPSSATSPGRCWPSSLPCPRTTTRSTSGLDARLKHPHHRPALRFQPFCYRLLGHRILRPLLGCYVRQPQQQSR